VGEKCRNFIGDIQKLRAPFEPVFDRCFGGFLAQMPPWIGKSMVKKAD
jgi:hypothetical protein